MVRPPGIRVGTCRHIPCLMKSHVVLLICRPSAVGLICLENWELGVLCTDMFLLSQVLLAQDFNPCTREAEAGGSLGV